MCVCGNVALPKMLFDFPVVPGHSATCTFLDPHVLSCLYEVCLKSNETVCAARVMFTQWISALRYHVDHLMKVQRSFSFLC